MIFYTARIYSEPEPRTLRELTVTEAAHLILVDVHEIRWAIEEDGNCCGVDRRGNDVMIVEQGDEARL